MKKSLIALAAVAAVSAASAQSSVTLYGIADMWVGQTKSTTAANVSTSATKAASGGLAGSRWGVKGNEDLGGGMRATFLFEQGLDLANGAASGFNRQAYVGVGGGFGDILLGNVYTALDDINGAANSGFDSALSATSNVWVGYTSNPNSNIKYVSPTFGGISGALSTNLDGNGSDARVVSLQVGYTGGPLFVGLAYQGDKQSQPGLNVRHTLVNGSYDFGAVKLLASVRNVTNPDNGAAKAKELQVGVDVPLSAALTLSAGYAQSQNQNAAGVDGEKRTGFGLAAGYSLSKRSTVYGGLQNAKVKGSDKSDRLLAVGVNHKF